MPWLATIGYGGKALDDFLATLREADISILIDVRQVPASRRAGFSKVRLREAVEAAGIRYVHLVGLGDPKAGRGAVRQGRMAEFRQIFDCHLRTDEAQSDLQTAAGLVQEGGACLLCYERQPEFCHRSIVANALAETIGLDVPARHCPGQVLQLHRRCCLECGWNCRGWRLRRVECQSACNRDPGSACNWAPHLRLWRGLSR